MDFLISAAQAQAAAPAGPAGAPSLMSPLVMMLLFFAVPFLIAMKISFSSIQIAMPPYTPLTEWANDTLQIKLNLKNYLFLLEDDLYLKAYLSSLKIAVIATFLCLLVGYPIAYAISRLPTASRNTAPRDCR
mgnify:CR=1 FL=1